MNYHSNIRQEWYLTCTQIAKRAVDCRVTARKAILIEKYAIKYYSGELTLDNIINKVWRDGLQNTYKHRTILRHYYDTYEKIIKEDFMYFEAIDKYPLQVATSVHPTVKDWKNMTEDEKAPYYSC